MEEQRTRLIKEINELKEEQQRLNVETQNMEKRRAQLQEISSSVKSAITDRALRELEQLDSEQSFISQKSVEDEAFLARTFQAKMAQVMKHKEDVERRLEAEGEFISQNMKMRVSKAHAHVLELRGELHEKAKELTEKLAGMTPDEIVKLKIEETNKACDYIAQKMAEGYRELDGLTSKMGRLEMILAKLEEQVHERESIGYGYSMGHRQRRSSNVAEKRARRPTA